MNELRRRSGDDLQFAGLVISPEPVNMADKQLVSTFAARVCAAAGSSCASGATEPSHVLLAMGQEEALARGRVLLPRGGCTAARRRGSWTR